MYMNLLTLEINRKYSAKSSRASAKGKRPVMAISANPGAVSSDIWRNYPFQKLYRAITGLVFLDVNQGCETSVCAATLEDSCLEAYRQRFHGDKSLRAGMSIRDDVPYLIPYHMPFPLLAFELLGEFTGARWGVVSLPDHSSIAENFYFERMRDRELLGVSFSTTEDLSKQLWDFSAELCKRILIHSGSNSQELAFLDTD
jgi:hypothetical protein